MADGSKVYERNGDKLFTPASNMKIYTTGVALDLFGVDYRWRTSVYANSQPDASGRSEVTSYSTDEGRQISLREQQRREPWLAGKTRRRSICARCKKRERERYRRRKLFPW